GGGTFLTFPTLVFAGVDSVVANASSSVLLMPGGASAAWVYRHASPIKGRWFWTILAGCVIGGLAGSELLLLTSTPRFNAIVPFLMLAAALIYTFSSQLAKLAAAHTASATHRGFLLIGTFLIAVYGGYFGAGMGVLMIVLFSIAGNMGVQE